MHSKRKIATDYGTTRRKIRLYEMSKYTQSHQFVLLDLHNQALQLVHEQLIAGLPVGEVLAEPSLQGLAHGDLLRLQEGLQHHLRVRAKDNELRKWNREIQIQR